MRDTPYTPDEKRVSDYIQDMTEGLIGSGDDPIGFLIASHRTLRSVVEQVVPGGLLRALIEADSVPQTAEPEQRRP